MKWMNEIFLNHNETIQVEKIRAEIERKFLISWWMVKGCDRVSNEQCEASKKYNRRNRAEKKREISVKLNLWTSITQDWATGHVGLQLPSRSNLLLLLLDSSSFWFFLQKYIFISEKGKRSWTTKDRNEMKFISFTNHILIRIYRISDRNFGILSISLAIHLLFKNIQETIEIKIKFSTSSLSSRNFLTLFDRLIAKIKKKWEWKSTMQSDWDMSNPYQESLTFCVNSLFIWDICIN